VITDDIIRIANEGQARVSNHQARVELAQRRLGFTPTDRW
jgi:hypothetical protein